MKNNIINTIETANTNNNTEKENTNMKKRRINTSGCKGKKVRCVETGKIYNTAVECAKEINCSVCSIYDHIGGRFNTLKGMHFEYVNGTEATDTKANMPEAPIDHDIPKEILIQPKSIVKGKGKRMNGNTKAVFDFTTGQFYTSGTDTAEHIGTTQGNVSRACNSKRNGRLIPVKGHKICYVKDIMYHTDEIGAAIHKANMYDDFTTKEEKRREMVAKLKALESKADNIAYEIGGLYEALSATEKEIEKVKEEIINFEF